MHSCTARLVILHSKQDDVVGWPFSYSPTQHGSVIQVPSDTYRAMKP